MSHPKTEGCCCRACMGKEPPPAHTASPDYPPMGDYRWVRIGDHWEESYITAAGTLVIPKPEYFLTDTDKFQNLLNTVVTAHGLSALKITGLKRYDKKLIIFFTQTTS